ncbi:uncharacterized protein TNCV_2416181 [Trichonephila clavipes]|nr:uncharacterized protein TNCV_2416181 [Trichonephila clavipes]
MKSGDLFIETNSAVQSKSYLSAKTFLDSSLLVTPHKSLNSSRGVISEPDLLYTSEAEILEGFSDQGVVQDVSALDRFNVHRCPTRRVFSGTGLDPVTKQATVDTYTTRLPRPPINNRSEKLTISSSVTAINKSSTSTQAELVSSTSSVTVASLSKSQPPNSVIDSAPTTSNSLSISAASSSSTACSVLETTSTISNTIPATSQDANQISKPRRKKRPPKNQSNTIKPKIEIKTAPHRPRKSEPTEYTTDEEDMIIYDVGVCVEEESELNPKYVLNMNGFIYKGELVIYKGLNSASTWYDFDDPIKKPF